MGEWVDFLLLREGGGAYCFCLITSKHPASNKHPPTLPIKTQKQNTKQKTMKSTREGIDHYFFTCL